jgi:hypothetical protein
MTCWRVRRAARLARQHEAARLGVTPDPATTNSRRRLCYRDDGGCGAPQVCPLCESCEEHCLNGGSGKCIEAHDEWLAGGMVEIVARVAPTGVAPFGPERTQELRAALRLDQDALLKENGLRRCSGCEGLEDPTRPHEHRIAQEPRH